jgi:hypothetical protein
VTADDQILMQALLHHANVVFSSDAPENVGRERELDNIKESTKLAERILAGNATDEDKQRVAQLVHPSVRTMFGL